MPAIAAPHVAHRVTPERVPGLAGRREGDLWDDDRRVRADHALAGLEAIPVHAVHHFVPGRCAMNMARRRWLTIAAAAALGLTGCDTDTQHAIDQCRLDLSRYHIEDWHTAVYMDECMKVAGYTLIANDHWSVDS